MYYQHETPFGPKLLKEGGAEFRIWAPDAKSMKLKLNGSIDAVSEMEREEDGWYKLTVKEPSQERNTSL